MCEIRWLRSEGLILVLWRCMLGNSHSGMICIRMTLHNTHWKCFSPVLLQHFKDALSVDSIHFNQIPLEVDLYVFPLHYLQQLLCILLHTKDHPQSSVVHDLGIITHTLLRKGGRGGGEGRGGPMHW